MDDKVYSLPTIPDFPFPEDISPTANLSTTASTLSRTNQTYGVPTTKEVEFPRQIVSRQTISETFNTQTKQILDVYSFGNIGAVVCGGYVEGVSGEVRMSPNGIVAKNVNGVTTFALDGTTGNATFNGEIMSGSVVTGTVYVGDTNGNVRIDGANKRIIINDGTHDRVIIGFQSGGF